MKKFALLFALCAILTVSANAQEYKKFKVGLGGGYAIPGGNGAKGGVLFYLEPAYRVQDNIAIGLRMEWAVLARGYSEEVGDASFDASASGSYSLNGQYYLMNGGFRPFVGAGVGIFSIKAASIDVDGQSQDLGLNDETKVGFYPRIGFDAGHFTLSIDYNLVGATKVEGADGEFKNSYIGIRFGGFFGGGRK
jgi:opacity protein-like surface antigen